MKFKVKKSPRIGDKRVVIKFAWFPVLAKGPEGEMYHIWLHKYHETQTFTYRGRWVPYGTDNWIS